MSSVPGKTVLSQMLEFYGLREHPFGVSPDPRFLYPSAQHREAMASLAFGIENQVGIAALIAEPGAGKTTLLFDVLQRFQHRASTAFVFNTQCGSADLLRQVVLELAIPGAEDERDPIRLHHIFTDFVARQVRTKPVIVIIDEAQNLESSALETLRLLSNFEAADHKLLHIILAGQPQLADKLRDPSLTQLLQRITMVSRLGRFSRKQMEECIAFRLRVAGFDGRALFSRQAMDRIMDASGGVPRELNRICINAMQLGFATRQRLIGEDVVDEVVSDLTLAKWIPEAELPLSGMRQPEAAAAAAASRAEDGGSSSPAAPTPEDVSQKPATPNAVQPVAPARDFPTEAYRANEAPQPEADRPPTPPPQPVSPQMAARIEAITRDADVNNDFVPPAPAQPGREESPARHALDRKTRRALLEAATNRRRLAELRLAGLKYREGTTSTQMRGLYPYMFAMGCVPAPGGDNTQPPAEASSPAESGNPSGGNRSAQTQAQKPESKGRNDGQDEDEKKTGT